MVGRHIPSRCIERRSLTFGQNHGCIHLFLSRILFFQFAYGGGASDALITNE